MIKYFNLNISSGNLHTLGRIWIKLAQVHGSKSTRRPMLISKKTEKLCKGLLELRNLYLGYSGGLVVKSPPCNAGDTGLILGLGRPHMLRGSWARKPQLQSLCFRTHPRQLLKPACSGACALQQEKPLQWEAHAPQ